MRKIHLGVKRSQSYKIVEPTFENRSERSIHANHLYISYGREARLFSLWVSEKGGIRARVGFVDLEVA